MLKINLNLEMSHQINLILKTSRKYIFMPKSLHNTVLTLHPCTSSPHTSVSPKTLFKMINTLKLQMYVAGQAKILKTDDRLSAIDESKGALPQNFSLVQACIK